MAFSEDIKTRTMVACGRCCCICHKFCGNNMEVHHIGHVQMAVQIHTTMQSHFALIVMQRFGNMILNIQKELGLQKKN